MGRRKERRLAAMSAAGRRVKLDLFAEPSGDLGGSSAQNEVGGDDDDTNSQAGLSNSPSSSGKQRENPLVLLGQYSDDELDEESSGEQGQIVSGDTPINLDDQEKLTAAQEIEEFDPNEGNGPGDLKVEDVKTESSLQLLDSLQETEADGTTDDHATEAGVVPEEMGLKEQASTISDTQAVADVILGWKLVFHEETNRYYYWNTATGETSWEVPDVLAQTTESADGKKDAADAEEKEGSANISKLTNQSTEINGSKVYKSSMDVDSRDEMLSETKVNPDLEQNNFKSSSHPNGAQNYLASSDSSLFSEKPADILLGEENANSLESLKCETRNELASSLMKRGEHLLEQLNTISGSKCNLQGYNLVLKYVLEVELRLGDIKSLASYGSSLIPFWLHSERKLQQLEIAVHDLIQNSVPEKFKEGDSGHTSHENNYNGSETHPSEKKADPSSSGESGALKSAGLTELQKNDLEVYSRSVSGAEVVSSDGCLTTYSDIRVGRESKVDGLSGPGEATPKTVLPSAEEVDMDIDMEVEDSTPTSSSNIGDSSGAQHHDVPSTSIPPPPEEDWIPPPPPDNEPFPPPPPEDPPEISYPQPSDVISGQSFSYAEQYMSYTGPNYGYYAQASLDLSSSNLYATAEACQPTVSNPALYYEALPDAYASAAMPVNPVDASVYYSLQDGISQLPMQSTNSVHQTSISEAVGPPGVHVEWSSSLLKEVNVPATDGEPKGASLVIQSSQPSLQDLATTSVTELVPAATATVAPATTSKAQSKVLRTKKKSVTGVSSLRSNKKVSSLVDKWKAAKEELQEQEEEPKNMLEILEKKRQREILEWRAQQIASGEARDNANFQPLGGDWRERIKRKRAQMASESMQTPSDAGTEGNQQPDLDELSKGLPNGWQVYWDDSSKQVYYGNSITSETTWTRPTT